MQTGQRETIDLDDVYQRAIWVHADTRDALLKERDSKNTADAVAQEKQNMRQRTSRAKRADTTIRSTADTPAPPELTLRQELAEAFKSASN